MRKININKVIREIEDYKENSSKNQFRYFYDEGIVIGLDIAIEIINNNIVEQPKDSIDKICTFLRENPDWVPSIKESKKIKEINLDDF